MLSPAQRARLAIIRRTAQNNLGMKPDQSQEIQPVTATPPSSAGSTAPTNPNSAMQKTMKILKGF